MTARRCGWCREDAPGPAVELTVVGWEDTGSGPGYIYFACPAHLKVYGLVPEEQHPPGSDGRPLYSALVEATNTAVPCSVLILALMLVVVR